MHSTVTHVYSKFGMRRWQDDEETPQVCNYFCINSIPSCDSTLSLCIFTFPTFYVEYIYVGVLVSMFTLLFMWGLSISEQEDFL